MAFTGVTITHDFDLPDGAGQLGTVEFTPAEPMHNGAKTVSGTRRAVLASGGVLSQLLDATTDPGTSPPGVPYRVVVRLTGSTPSTSYVRVPHDQGSTLDLATLLAQAGSSGSGSGGGFTYSPVTLTAVSGTITPNAALGYGPHRYIATADVTLAAPTGGSNGQPLEVQVKASGGDRVLTVAGGTVTVPSGTWWWGRFSYVSADTAWILNDSGGGSSGTGYTDEQVRDVIGTALVAGSNVTITPNDSGDVITISAATSGSAGIPASTVDAKGDLIAGTANDTVARLGVGSDGQVLTAASGAVTGLAWTTPTGATSTSTQPLYSRGVNLAGAEFASDAAHLPGSYGTDYSYPATAELTAMAARGYTVVRVPLRWERIQPTRGAALNTTELGRLTTLIAAAHTAGLQVIPDVHNYARFIDPSGSGGLERVLGSTNLPVSQLVDLWTRLSTALKGNVGVYAYGLMNEPHDLSAVSGTFTGTVRYDWASGVQGWTGDTATASNVSGKLRLTASLGSGSVNMRKDDAATVSGGSTPTGNIIRFELTPVALPAGTWTAKAQWQNSTFTYLEPSTVMTRIDTGAVVTSLTVGQPVFVTCVFSSIDSPPHAFAIEVDGTGATAGTVTVDVDNFSQGSASGAKTGAQVWEDASQQCVTAIRGNADTTKILVAGYGFSGAQSWASNHSAPWITTGGDVAYEAHYYFDVDNSGDYPDTYATENAAAITHGYASLAARVVAELGVFTGWCNTHSVAGFVGEIGWPNTADTASWNAVGEACYDLLDTHQVGATYWSAGARWGTSYNLSAYTGASQDVVKSPATVIEAHLTASADVQTEIADLTARVGVLEAGGGTTSTAVAATPHRGPAFMVLGADTAPELTAAKSAGATHGLAEVIWDQVQSSAGGAVDASGALANIARIQAAGLKVCLRVSLQYPPTFVQTGVPKFQSTTGGAVWTGTQANGDNVRDWVWSGTGRGYVKDLYAKLFAQLDWSKIERVQVGGLRAGELSFPVTDGTVWWGFSAAAQSGTDLAPRMAVCPVPGVTPSTGTTWTNNDMLFVGWYLQSLTNWMLWCIEQHRRWFAGPVYVMHPGFGLRSYMDPTGSGAAGYREMVANGLDWAGQIGAYPDADVHPYSTWVDATHSGAQPYSATNTGDAAPWLALLKTARSLGRAGGIWGENTGGQSNTDMDRVFQTGAVAHGYQGVGWLSADSLGDGSTDTYANFTTRITAAS